MLGYMIGFGPALIRHRARAWGLVHLEGVRSAQQLALMSGLYTAVHCICGRIRMKEDGWNRGLAGCSTGLVLGWSTGPWGAAQSCLGIGALSYFLDFGDLATQATKAGPAAASELGASGADSRAAGGAGGGREQLLPWEEGLRAMQRQLLAPAAALSVPPLMWLGGCCGGPGGGRGGACELGVTEGHSGGGRRRGSS